MIKDTDIYTIIASRIAGTLRDTALDTLLKVGFKQTEANEIVSCNCGHVSNRISRDIQAVACTIKSSIDMSVRHGDTSTIDRLSKNYNYVSFIL